MIELNYKVFGQGMPLLILHGLFGSLDNWVSHARKLSEYYSVYLIDQRNHGKSPHMEPWDYPTMAEDLFHFMDNQGIYKAYLLGHSMGGKTVMQFATSYPEMIEKLIVADMAPKGYPPHHTEILDTLTSIDLTRLNSRKEAKQKLEERIADASIVQFLLKNLGRTDDNSFRWKFNLEVINRNYLKILEPINLEEELDFPSLFIHGEHSDYLVEADKEVIKSYFPEAEFQMIPDAGHWVHAENPATFLQVVQKYLDE